MNPQLLASACLLYSTSPDRLVPLSGGHTNAVYKFPLPQTWQDSKTCQVSKASQLPKFGVLRIGVEDCPPEQTLGMLEWVLFLHDEGAPVIAPLVSINNHLLENLEQDGIRYTITAFEKAEGTLAEDIPPPEWTDDLFCSIGKAAGKLHHTSHRYKPSHPGFTRPMWFDSYEVHEATSLLATSTDPARDKLAALLIELKQLPTSTSEFGLIHEDLHFANFLILPDGHVSIIDFDDCGYGWYAMDVAMALFDVLVLYNPAGEDERKRFAYRFMSSYLAGYRQENPLPPFWLSQVPRFLKLKELCIYATLIGNADIALPDSWVGRFMRDRSTRIANDIPYVDIEFTAL
jgi:Ser/Thr protein kinase RdoA (MazF antagonist)